MSKKSNLTGKRFTKLVVIEGSYTNRHGQYCWRCQCDCGNNVIVCGYSLTTGHTKSCGCLQKETASKYNKINLKNQQFGRLIVIEEAGKSKNRHVLWKCKCSCGNQTIVSSSKLISGHTSSCGCLNREISSKLIKDKVGCLHPAYKHGLSYTSAYINAKSMEQYAKKLNQTPQDVNKEAIQLYYIICEHLNKDNPGMWEVDHWKPLSKGGLHHEDNLQILLKYLNREKFAKYPLTEKEQKRYEGFRI